MALSNNLVESKFGISFQGVYYRINNVMVHRISTISPHTVMIDIAGYAQKPENEDLQELCFHRLHALLSDVEAQGGPNILTNCYLWLAAQPEFAGAVAV